MIIRSPPRATDLVKRVAVTSDTRLRDKNKCPNPQIHGYE
jgi:hypothetical protein